MGGWDLTKWVDTTGVDSKDEAKRGLGVKSWGASQIPHSLLADV